MESKEQADDGQKGTSCVAAITEAYLIAKSINEQSAKIARLEKSKSLIKNETSHERRISHKTESSIEKLESATTASKKRLNMLDKNTIEKVMDKVTKAVESVSQVDISKYPSTVLEYRNFINMDSYLEKIKDMERRINVAKEKQLDKSDNLRNIIDQADNALISLISTDYEKAEEMLQKDSADVEKIIQNLEQAKSETEFDQLVDESTHKLFGSQSQSEMNKKYDIPALLTQKINDYFGEQLLIHLIGGPKKSSIYPPKDESVRSLQVRDFANNKCKIKKPANTKLKKALTKIAKMKKESDEMVLLLETNLNSWPVKNLYENLGHIDRITKNHKTVLDVVSDPWGDLKNPEFLQEQKERAEMAEEDPEMGSLISPVPQQIRLYPNNEYLSATLATTLAEYTNKLYFSDLTQRVEELEKKLL